LPLHVAVTMCGYGLFRQMLQDGSVILRGQDGYACSSRLGEAKKSAARRHG